MLIKKKAVTTTTAPINFMGDDGVQVTRIVIDTWVDWNTAMYEWSLVNPDDKRPHIKYIYPGRVKKTQITGKVYEPRL